MAMDIKRFNVLGVAVSAMTLPIATQAVLAAARERRKGYVCVTGVHGVTEAQNDPAFRDILNKAFLVTTDGMPLVWLGKKDVGGWVGRVYGPDLMAEVFRSTEDGALTHFLYGGAPGVADHLKGCLEKRFPGVRIVGTYCPPFRPLNPEERAQLSKKVSETAPSLFWVGLSTPKQERFMSEYLPHLDTAVMLGVGAAFDFHSGKIRQAPRWMQQSGLEWLFRLCTEPKRLWKRYCINNPLFVGRVLLQITGLRKHRLE